jgi:hypothetical protein
LGITPTMAVNDRFGWQPFNYLKFIHLTIHGYGLGAKNCGLWTIR